MHFIVRVMMERVLASPVCRGEARNFSRFPIDDATGCLLFLVLRRNGVLSGHWLELMHPCYGDPGSNLPLNAWGYLRTAPKHVTSVTNKWPLIQDNMPDLTCPTLTSRMVGSEFLNIIA